MKSKHLIVLALFVSLMLSAWVPPAIAGQATADTTTVKITINNKTTETLTVTLTGPATYTVSAKPGKTKVDVLPGKYRYRYSACGSFRSGNLQLQRSKDKLLISACPGAGKGKGKTKEIQFTLVNDTGGYLTILLSGPAPYTFHLPNGKTKLTTVKGKFTYTVYSVCGSTSGTINLKSKAEWKWWCE